MHYLRISLIELLRTIREREIIVFKCDQYIPLIFNSQVKRILEKFHDNNGHLGMERTFCALSSQYHWKGFYNDVVQYVRSCPKCQTMGPFKKSEEELHPIPIVRPWHHLDIDLFKMPQSNQGNNYILTVVDYFAKWLEATTLPDKSARTVSSTLYKIFLHMGFPAVVSSDQGREFVNGVLDTLQQKSKTEQRVSSAYHPEINGLVERFNQILQNMLAKVCPDENDWDLYLVTFSKACKR